MKKNYLFGYGSLISEDSKRKTGLTGKSFIVKVNDYKRSWNVLIPEEKTVGLGIEKRQGDSCNGVMFKIDEKELLKFDERETNNYERINIPAGQIEFLDNKSIKDGKIWVYLTKNKGEPNKEFPIQQSYIDVILTGCLEISKGFAEEFMRTTSGWKLIQDDRISPKYPRALNKLKFKNEIDKLIEKKLK